IDGVDVDGVGAGKVAVEGDVLEGARAVRDAGALHRDRLHAAHLLAVDAERELRQAVVLVARDGDGERIGTATEIARRWRAAPAGTPRPGRRRRGRIDRPTTRAAGSTTSCGADAGNPRAAAAGRSSARAEVRPYHIDILVDVVHHEENIVRGVVLETTEGARF